MLDRYGDITRFSLVFSPKQTDTFAKSPERCITGSAPQLSVMEEGYGRAGLILWLKMHINALNELIGPQHKMSAMQVDSLVGTIATEYSSLRCTEIMLFLSRFKAGRYGHFYGNVDPLVITDALAEYVESEERKNAAYKKQQEIAKEKAGWTGREVTREEYLAMLPEDKRAAVEQQYKNYLYRKSHKSEIRQSMDRALERIRKAWE